MAESEEELKSLLIRVKEESEKTGLKLSMQKTKIMASSPITSWQIEREKVEAVTDFIFLGSKITVYGDCSHEIKRCLLLRRKATTNLDSVLKSRDITLLTKVHIVKAMLFPVVNHSQPHKRMSHIWQFMKIAHLLSFCYGVCPFQVKIWKHFLFASKKADL